MKIERVRVGTFEMGKVPYKILKNGRIGSNYILFDAELQGEQLCCRSQLMKTSLKKAMAVLFNRHHEIIVVT